MYRVSIELYKHEWKFGTTKNAVGTRAAGECFHSFFEFSQTFTSVCITVTAVLDYNLIETQSTCFLFLLENTTTRKKESNLLTLIIKM